MILKSNLLLNKNSASTQSVQFDITIITVLAWRRIGSIAGFQVDSLLALSEQLLNVAITLNVYHQARIYSKNA
jgi:hypothetical protein